MRRWVLWAAALAAVAGGCAPRGLLPSPLGASRDPAPLVASLAAYNAGPKAVRLQGSLKDGGRGTVDFGATVVEGTGLRFDAVAGPFSTPLVALGCRTGESCVAYVPDRRKAYEDGAGRWEGLLGPALRGRVPRVENAATLGAWDTASGRPALVLQGQGGWHEHIEFTPDGSLPAFVFLGREDGRPELRIEYGEPGEPVDSQPFPTRLAVWLREADKTYEIRFRRVESALSGVDPGLFVLSLPPGTAEESLRGKAIWEQTGIPAWPTTEKGLPMPP